MTPEVRRSTGDGADPGRHAASSPPNLVHDRSFGGSPRLRTEPLHPVAVRPGSFLADPEESARAGHARSRRLFERFIAVSAKHARR
jgi:hypothetical protein